MEDEPRRKWAVFSGLTRREQQVLTFLILLIAAGLAYEQYKGGWRREQLTLHRATTGASEVAPTPAVVRAPRGKQRESVTTEAVEGPLDLNQASAEQLEGLPGIGPVRAKAIVRYLEIHGPFRRMEDLKQVGGIGDKTLDTVRPYLKPLDSPTTPVPTAWPATLAGKKAIVSEPAPRASSPPEAPHQINLNTATIEELDTLEGIGPALARRIVEYRQQHGPFRTPAEIQKVPGIGPHVFQLNRDRLTVGPSHR